MAVDYHELDRSIRKYTGGPVWKLIKYWNLSRNSLDDQSEATINYLHEILNI